MKMVKRFLCMLLVCCMVAGVIPMTANAYNMGKVGYYQTISAGGFHSLAIRADASLWAWGENCWGQLGDGTTSNRYIPQKIMDNVETISAGYLHSLAIKTDSSLWAWGWNRNGELGDGTTTYQSIPVKVMENVAAVSAGGTHSLAIQTDGSLWAWGDNVKGQLGDGTVDNHNIPVKVMNDVVAVSAGQLHSLAIKTDGSLWAWGDNGRGQLGDGTTSDHYTPIKVMDGVVAISAGSYYSLAIKTDGSLWAWGDNRYSQLGDGTTTDSSIAVKIMDNVVTISAGFSHSFAIKTDGSLWAWGWNCYGQLGDGTTTGHSTPVRVIDDVAAVSAGNGHCLAIRTDNTLWAWGQNEDGQLGDGATDDCSTPIKVIDSIESPTPSIVPATPTGTDTSAKYLSSWNSATQEISFGDTEVVSPYAYTLADGIDTSNVNNLLNKYVLVTVEQGDSVLEYTVTDIQPINSAIGTVSDVFVGEGAMGVTSFRIEEVEENDFTVIKELVDPEMYKGKQILYHYKGEAGSYGEINDFTVLEEKSGTLEAWDSATGRATIDGVKYPTNFLSDLSFQNSIDEYLQKGVYFVTAGSSDYSPLLKITGSYYPGGKLEDFDPTIYHATWLAKGGNAADILSDDTPSDIMMEVIDESGTDVALDTWRAFELVFDSLSDITTLSDFALGIDQEDMYSALILTALETKASYDIIPSQAEEGVKLSKSLISNVSSALKADYGIELNNDDKLQEIVALMPGVDVDAYLEKQTSEWLKKTQPDLGDLRKSFKWISNGIKAVGTVEDYGEYISACVTLSQTDEYIKEVLNLAYLKSSSVFGPSYSLTRAFKECLDMFSSGTEEMFEKIQAGTITMLGEGAVEYVVGDILWGEVTSYINTACPEVAILQIGYVAGKTISSWLCNTDDAAEQYLKMDYITDIETILDAVYNDLRLDFSMKKDVKTAGTYLSAMSFSFQLRDGDCDNAYKYVDAIDTSLLSKIEQAFGKESNEELKNAIQGIQKNYSTSHVGAETDWIFSLEDDYPGSGLYEQYEQTIDGTRNRILKKEITAACPVDVYVYDQSDNVVASVVNGRVSCSADDVMIALLGDEKVVRLYNGADYRVEYVGSDTGEMDVTVSEFTEGATVARTVNYYGVALDNGKAYSMNANSETLQPYELLDTQDSSVVGWDYDSMAEAVPHTVKVISGTLRKGGEIYAETTASKGETVQLNAYVPEGYEFVRWEVTSENAEIADALAASTTMIMPDENVTLTAVMKETQSSGGSTSEGGGSTSEGGDSSSGGSTGGGSTGGGSTGGGSTSGGSTGGTSSGGGSAGGAGGSGGSGSSGSSGGSGGSGSSGAPKVSFTDVASDAWYYAAVQYVAERSLMAGYGNNRFGPEDNVTRGQFAQILYNKEGKPAVTTSADFTDISDDAWYAAAVAWAAKSKVVSGYGNGKFGPGDEVTREQMAVMLYRYAGEPRAAGTLNGFTDADEASGYAVDALRWAVDKGILTGKGGGVLDPKGNATRAEVAAILMRYLENT